MSATAEATVNQLAAALRYAQLGWAVFPLHSLVNGACTCGDPHEGNARKQMGKHPRTKNGCKDASKDPAKIRGWWRTWPDANIGIATGAISDIWALDIDTDKNGHETLGSLPDLPETVESATGSGGRHLLFKYPGWKLGNSVESRLGAGLDTRGDGGYIVAAPSVHYSGRLYEWKIGRGPGCPVADAPDWLLAKLKPAPPPPPAPPRPDPLAAEIHVLRRARAYLDHTPGAVSGERGHDATFIAAQRMVRGFNLNDSDAYGVLVDWNTKCVPPWPEMLLRRKITEAREKGTMPFGCLRDQPDPKRIQSSPAPAAVSRQPGEDDGEETAELLYTSVADTDLDSEPDKPIEWVLPIWLQARTSVLIVAQPNAGKTFLALDWAAKAAAAGKRVYVLEEEGSRDALKIRLRRAYRAAGYVPCGLVRAAHRTSVSLLDRRHFAFLVNEIKGYDVAIIDSLTDVTTEVDENDSSEMKKLAVLIQKLSVETGACIISLHHITKESTRSEKPSITAVRGHSALGGKIDTAYYLVKGNCDTTAVRFHLHCVKQREGAAPDPREVSILMTGPAASAEYVKIEQRPQKPAKEDSEATRIEDMLDSVEDVVPFGPDNGLSGNALFKSHGGNRGDFNKALSRLVRHERVLVRWKGDYPLHYRKDAR